ncbi:class I glutamine amidotransferase-like protein [Hyaloscypha sp. PMI_1271]|nr:class I glutamine amidotransferase-like protein [Hyaloscypha sp. PMI_1271]
MGSLTPSRPLKIAILINTDEPPYTPLFTSAYTSIFNTLSPTSKLTFYSPPSLTLPSPTELSNHDLLINGGGTYVVDESSPWVVKELEFLKSTVRDFPRLKIVAICFGHQKYCQAFGGELGWNKAGKAELGITTLPLTPFGHKFFPSTSSPFIKLHELHRKEIATPAPGFIELAENNQICLSESGRILTFQGHPEMSVELARALIESESVYTKGLSEMEKRKLLDGAEGMHDGVAVWRRVLEWVGEGRDGV